MPTYTTIESNALLQSTLPKTSTGTVCSAATLEMDHRSPSRRPSLQLSPEKGTAKCLLSQVSRAQVRVYTGITEFLYITF